MNFQREKKNDIKSTYIQNVFSNVIFFVYNIYMSRKLYIYNKQYQPPTNNYNEEIKRIII